MILRIEQDQKQPPQRTLQQEPGTRCPNKRHCAEDRTFAPAFRTVAGNGWLGRATCWAAWIHHESIITHHYPLLCGYRLENGNVPPQMANFSWGKWWEKLVDFGAFHGFPWLSAKARSRKSLGNAAEMGRKVARLSEEKLGERFPWPGDRWIGCWLKIFCKTIQEDQEDADAMLFRSESGTWFFVTAAIDLFGVE